uniref:Predicted protein n=1 Tax=Hordeum vulgare subsp. vulgare TaxID=112509 RepID=F2D6F3_HORVV|nr:predicted protein [Hordeum vulgare subsp. vulgare]
MSVFMILVVNTDARVISWAGMHGDCLPTVVIRRGATNVQECKGRWAHDPCALRMYTVKLSSVLSLGRETTC